jgi:protein dithiol:quinone oxidoreductase
VGLPNLSPRQWYAAVAAACVALIGYAMFLQFIKELEPCPLCILQRYAFVLVALLAGCAAAFKSPRIGRALAGLAAVSALGGAGIASWHVKLQLFPPEIGSCGPGLTYLITELPLARALPRIFQGGGDCTVVDWSFLGLSIPAWSFIWLVLLAIALIIGLRKPSPNTARR